MSHYGACPICGVEIDADDTPHTPHYEGCPCVDGVTSNLECVCGGWLQDCHPECCPVCEP